MSTDRRGGKLSKSVRVFSNDPKTPQLPLKISGMVEVLAGFEPRYLALGRVAKEEKRVVRTVKVIGKMASDLKLTKIESDRPDQLRAKLIKKDGERLLEVEFKSLGKEGRFRANLTAHTNLPKLPKLSLAVWAVVVGDLALDRTYVFFTTNAKTSTQQVRITSTAGRPFRVTSIKDKEKLVTGQATRDGKAWVVKLTLAKKPDKPSRRSGTVTIRTDRRDQRELSVRYTLAASRPPGRSQIRPNLPIRSMRPTKLKPNLRLKPRRPKP